MAIVNGVREYNRIRRYLEYIYLYGYYGRTDFEKEHIGATKDYDDFIQLVKMPLKLSEINRTARKNNYTISRKFYQKSEEILSQSYMFHAASLDVTVYEITSILTLLAQFKSLTAQEICDLIGEVEDASTGNGYNSVSRRLKDMTEHGLLKKDAKKYSLSGDVFAALSDEELLQLFDYLLFAQAAFMPKVPCSYILRAAQREISFRGLHRKNPSDSIGAVFSLANNDFNESSTVLVRHNKPRSVCDEDLLYVLLKAINQRKYVQLTFIGATSVDFLPTAIRADYRLGRWYVVGVRQQNSTPTMLRIKSLLRVTPTGQAEDAVWNNANDLCETTYRDNLFSTNNKNAGIIGATLYFQDKSPALSEFQNELQLGEVRSTDAGWRFQAQVNDYIECVPLLRSYSPWLTIDTGAPDIHKRILDDLYLMRDHLLSED